MVLHLEIDDAGTLLVNGKRAQYLSKPAPEDACRSVFAWRDRVIKFDSKMDPKEEWSNQTASELRLLAQIERDDRLFFPRVYEFGLFTDRKIPYLVQERIKRRGGKRSAAATQIIKSLCKKYKIEDVYTETGWEGNWCVRKNGLPVIFDCGLWGT